jgi:hypothetical protein
MKIPMFICMYLGMYVGTYRMEHIFTTHVGSYLNGHIKSYTSKKRDSADL